MNWLTWIKLIMAPLVGDSTYYGAITIRIEAGKIVHVKDERSMRPPETLIYDKR